MKSLPTASAGWLRRLSCTLTLATASLTLPVAAQVLFEESFDTDTSSAWTVVAGSGDGVDDYTVQFGFDYGAVSYTSGGVTQNIPPAPNSPGGTTKGVYITINNNDDVAATSAVSLFPNEPTFSGDYSVQFDMWINYNGPAYGGTGSTEFANFGINHSGDHVLWRGNTGDGVWFIVAGEAGAGNASGDYGAYVGDGADVAIQLDGFLGGFLEREGQVTTEINPAQPNTLPLKRLFPSPTFESAGAPGKAWVEVEIRQRSVDGVPKVTWLMNGYVIAEHSEGSGLGQTSGKLMLGAMDIFSSIANPAADNFFLYDNLRVINLTDAPDPTLVSISAEVLQIAEPNQGTTFTISRTGDTTDPLIVNYRVGGTATAGLDYETLPGTVLIPAGQSSVTVPVTALDDLLGEQTETLLITLAGNSVYDVREAYGISIEVLDDGDLPSATVAAVRPVAYEGNSELVGRFQINLASPGESDLAIGYTLEGTAQAGTDYVALPGTLTFLAGEVVGFIDVVPVNNAAISGNRTLNLTLSPGTGYALGATAAAAVTIVEDDLEAGTSLYTETFDADATGRWTVNKSTGDNTNDDGSVADFHFDYSAAGIPPAPNSAGGSTRALKLQANLSGGIFSGLSVSPNAQNFTGDLRLRFDLWINYQGPLPAGGSGSTQVAGAGVGTAGTSPQWAAGTQDSVWFGATGDGGSGVDYRAYSPVAGSGYDDVSGVFAAGSTGGPRNNTHPYYAGFGRQPAPQGQLDSFPGQSGLTSAGVLGFAWRDVVIEKRGTQVSWFVDGLRLATVDASEITFGGGNILFNYFDINAGSTTDPNAPDLHFALVDNVRVQQLTTTTPTQPEITGTTLVTEGLRLTFTGSTNDAPTAFSLVGSETVNGAYTPVAGATISQTAPGTFEVIIPLGTGNGFYQIQR
jgi:hypothetical protein